MVEWMTIGLYGQTAGAEWGAPQCLELASGAGLLQRGKLQVKKKPALGAG